MKIIDKIIDGKNSTVSVLFEFDHKEKFHSCTLDLETINSYILPQWNEKLGKYITANRLPIAGSKTITTVDEAIDAMLGHSWNNACESRGLNLPLPDTTEVKSLCNICFKDDYSDEVIINPRLNKVAYLGVDYSPLYTPPEALSPIADIVFTPEVKQAYQDSLPVPPRKQKTEKVLIEQVEIQGDRAVVVTKEIDKLVTRPVLLFKNDVPVMNGKTQATIEVPVYENE